jgi:uncharacterized protein YdhG (YjbR/CyaY superfamily)
MVSSKETTAAAYLASLPPEQRKVVSAVRAVVKKHLPKGYVETMNWGMLCYEVPLARYPDTYNGKPLMYAALAAQKNYYALYLTGPASDETQMKRLTAAYQAAGKKLDMGKGCLRFKSLEELPLDVIADMVASKPVDDTIAAARAAKPAKPAKRK